jgi:hypothetical protein
MDEAIDLLRSKQQPDGTWLLENTHPGKVHFALEDGDSLPSRWNTLRACVSSAGTSELAEREYECRTPASRNSISNVRSSTRVPCRMSW